MTYQLEAADLEGEPLTYSSLVRPAWLQADSISGLISGAVPDEGVKGFSLVVMVQDERRGFDQLPRPWRDGCRILWQPILTSPSGRITICLVMVFT